MTDGYEIKGAKIAEITHLYNELEQQTENCNVLIVGEHSAGEGITQTVCQRPFKKCVCTDIVPIKENNTLDKLMQTNKNIKFVQKDFIDFDETEKYEFIVCINVLEHFGMNFAESHGFAGALSGDDYIRWNHDLRAVKKMIKLLSDKKTSRIIVTVPLGHPICFGDVNPSNYMPFLRRYDATRIKLIEELVKSLGMKMKNKYYFSNNFVEWYEADSSILQPQQLMSMNPHSPNALWAFTITK